MINFEGKGGLRESPPNVNIANEVTSIRHWGTDRVRTVAVDTSESALVDDADDAVAVCAFTVDARAIRAVAVNAEEASAASTDAVHADAADARVVRTVATDAVAVHAVTETPGPMPLLSPRTPEP